MPRFIAERHFFSPLGGGLCAKCHLMFPAFGLSVPEQITKPVRYHYWEKMNDAVTPCQTYLYCFTNARAVTPGWLHKHIGFEFDLISYEFIAAPSIHCIILSFKK